MPRAVDIPLKSSDPVINISLDTIQQKRQALVFCNTKRGAESQAEKIANKAVVDKQKFQELSERALTVLATPTKQCKRLAKCLTKGIAFHHAGLHAKQRALIEENFREGLISIICSTPTLAIGMDLPAFRVIIRDLKRFSATGSWGMVDIPVLEYHQMAGRAGRPGKETFGEAIILAETPSQAEQRKEQYIHGEPEEIYSKLAVEPVLRTYILSLIATEFVHTREELIDFFSKTFYAKQYGDMQKLQRILDAMTEQLLDWEFLKSQDERDDFTSANKLQQGKLEATLIGRRVAELYLDPYTAHFLITCLQKNSGKLHDFPILQMLSSCLELRPLLRPRVKEIDEIIERTTQYSDLLLTTEPTQYSHEYEDFLQTLKTGLFFLDWIEEVQEDTLMERFAIRPGEIHMKLERADWLLYATEELARLCNFQSLRAPLARMRIRLKHGAREELLPLLKLKGVGRVRARKMFVNRITSVQDLKKVEFSTLAALIGPQLAKNVKEQMGETVDPAKLKVPKGRRQGQLSMSKFG